MTTLQPLPEALDLDQASARWGASIGKLRCEIRNGNLKAIKPGNKILIQVDEGDSWYRRSGEKLIKIGKARRRIK